MPKSIAVFGAGPGLGRAVARRYAREGYDVVLVARRGQPLDSFAQDLTGIGASAWSPLTWPSPTPLPNWPNGSAPRLASLMRCTTGRPQT